MASTHGEYHIVYVDLIAPRGGGWKETGDCDPLSLSNTSPDPLGDPLRRGMTAAAGLQGFSQLVSGAFVTSQFRILYSYLCSALYRSRFSRGVGLWSHVFHYWGRGCSFLRIRGVLLWSIVGITANREWNVNMADEGEENRILSFHLQYGIICTVSYHCTGNYIPQSLPVEGG